MSRRAGSVTVIALTLLAAAGCGDGVEPHDGSVAEEAGTSIGAGFDAQDAGAGGLSALNAGPGDDAEGLDSSPRGAGHALCSLDASGAPTCADACADRRVCTVDTSRGCAEEASNLLVDDAPCIAFAPPGGRDASCTPVRDDTQLPEAIQPFGSPSPSFEDEGLAPGGGTRSVGGLRAARTGFATFQQLDQTVRVRLPATCDAPCIDGVVMGWVTATWRPDTSETEPPWLLAVAISASQHKAWLLLGDRVLAQHPLDATGPLEVSLRSDPFQGVTMCVGTRCTPEELVPLPRGPLAPVIAGRSLQGGDGTRLLAWKALARTCDISDLVETPAEPLRLVGPGETNPWPGAPPDVTAPSLLVVPGEPTVLLAFEARESPDGTPQVHLAERRQDGSFEVWMEAGGTPVAVPGRAPRLLYHAEGPRLLVLPQREDGEVRAFVLDLDARGLSERTMLDLTSLPPLTPPPEASARPMEDPASGASPIEGGAQPFDPIAAAVLPSGEEVWLARDGTARWRLGIRTPSDAMDWTRLGVSWLPVRLAEKEALGPIEDVSLQAVDGAWSLLVTVRQSARREVHQLLSHDLVGWRDLGTVLRADGSNAERIDVGRASEAILPTGERLVVYEAFDGRGHGLRQRWVPLPR